MGDALRGTATSNGPPTLRRTSDSSRSTVPRSVSSSSPGSPTRSGAARLKLVDGWRRSRRRAWTCTAAPAGWRTSPEGAARGFVTMLRGPQGSLSRRCGAPGGSTALPCLGTSRTGTHLRHEDRPRRQPAKATVTHDTGGRDRTHLRSRAVESTAPDVRHHSPAPPDTRLPSRYNGNRDRGENDERQHEASPRTQRYASDMDRCHTLRG